MNATLADNRTGDHAAGAAAAIGVAALFFSNGSIMGAWVSRVPAIQDRLDLSHGALGLALLSMAVGALLSMPVAGQLAARCGSAPVCRAAALLYFGILPLLAWAPTLHVLAASLFAFGAAHGALDVAMNSQAVETENCLRRPIMSRFHALFSLGGLAGSLGGGALAAAGISPAFHFAASAFLLGALALVIAFPPLLPRPSSEPLSPAAEPAPPQSRTPLDQRRLPARLIALGFVAFCVMLGEGAMADWSAVYLHRETGAGEALAAAGYAAFSLFMAAGRLARDALSTRFGPVTLVRASGLTACCGLGIALITGQTIPSLIGFAATGAGFATVVPQAFRAAGHVPGVAIGPALATVTTMGYFGFLIGPALIGFAADVVGLRTALCLLAAASFALIFLAPQVRIRRERSLAPYERTIELKAHV